MLRRSFSRLRAFASHFPATGPGPYPSHIGTLDSGSIPSRGASVASHQAQVRLILGTDPRRLLKHAATEFLVPLRATPANPFPSPPVLLALRQGGIRDDLYALAHERGVAGWYDPPLCTFQELPRWLGSTTRTPLGDLARRAILARLVREARGVLGGLRHPERFVHALDNLVGELAREEVAPDAFAAALEARPDRDDFERRRDAELAAVYRGYCAALESEGARDGRATYADCARALRERPDLFATRLGGRRELRLFGLQDLTGGWRFLLGALRDAPSLDRVTIYSSEALPLDADLEAETLRLEEPDSLAGRLFGSPGDARVGEVALIAAPDAEREVEEVARRIRGLADSGVPLHRMAVVARKARPHTELVAGALERFGVPATLRRRQTLREIPVVRALAALFAAAGEGWGRHGLAELADQPYFASELDARAINAIGFARRVVGLPAWAEAFAEGEEATLVADFQRFAARAAELDQPRTVTAWIAWLRRFLEDDPWRMRAKIDLVPGGRFDVVRLDLVGWNGLARLVGEWADAVEGWGADGTTVSAKAFHAQLDELLEFEVALWTPDRRGVPVLEGLAGAYRSFEHLFLVGCEAGSFPAPAPTSPLLDDEERAGLARAGLPLELTAEWDRREQELFRILVAGARERLVVSYARLDAAGREVVRSSFVDSLADATAAPVVELPLWRVLTPGIRLLSGPGVEAHAEHAARVELDRASGRLSPWNGRIERPELVARLAQRYGDDHLWSPTQLESYAKCPWAWFSGRLLGVQALEDPDDEMDAKTVGSVFHKALQLFYDNEVARSGGAVMLRAGDLGAALPRLHAALDAALTEMGDTSWLGTPVMAGAKRMELRRTLTRFLEFEVAHNDSRFNNRTNAAYEVRTAVERHELAFNDAVLDRGGVRLRYRGTIDRVEVGRDDRVPSSHFVAAVDYKTGKYSAPGGGKKEAWGEGVVLQVPLYAHALAALRPGAVVSRVEYRALKQREVVHALQLRWVERKARLLVEDAEEEARMSSALDAAVRHVHRVRRGEFPADPPSTCGCPSFCHARDICRVAGGPREVRP